MAIEQYKRSIYHRTACIVLVLIPYYLFMFTWWGNPYHSAPWTAIAFNAFLVVGAYASLEYYRHSSVPWQRAAILGLGMPLGLYILLALAAATMRVLST